MEFKITEAEAREMARFEEEVGCDISAGADWGVHFDKVINLVLEQANIDDSSASDKVGLDRTKSLLGVTDLTYETIGRGNVLSFSYSGVPPE